MSVPFFVCPAIKADTGTWRLGLVVCLSGACAPDGTQTVAGSTLAAEDLNKKGGVLGQTVAFSVQDTEETATSAKAVSAFQQLRLDSSIRYFVGPSWTPASLALAPFFAKDPTLFIFTSTSGSEDFHRTASNIFNAHGADQIMTRSMARYALKRGWRRAAVFSSQQAWELDQGNFFKDEFEKGGGKVLIKVEPLHTLPDVRAEAYQVVNSKPDLIFFSNYVQLGLAARRVTEIGYTGPRLATFIDPERYKESQGTLEETPFPNFIEISQNFSDRYEQRFKEPARYPATLAYDMLLFVAQAIETVKTFDVPKVSQYLLQNSYQGVSGQLKFDAQGGALHDPILVQYKNGQVVKLPLNEQ